MKIGIIGFGAIGFDVAKKLDQEKDQFNVIGVHSRTKNKIIDKTTSFNSPLRYLSLDEIFKKCDVVIDCAPKETFKKIIKSSAFCSSDDKIVSDNYKIVKKQNFSIIPPIGGG